MWEAPPWSHPPTAVCRRHGRREGRLWGEFLGLIWSNYNLCGGNIAPPPLCWWSAVISQTKLINQSLKKVFFFFVILYLVLDQVCQTYGPRIKTGPLGVSIRPTWCILKKKIWDKHSMFKKCSRPSGVCVCAPTSTGGLRWSSDVSWWRRVRAGGHHQLWWLWSSRSGWYLHQSVQVSDLHQRLRPPATKESLLILEPFKHCYWLMCWWHHGELQCLHLTPLRVCVRESLYILKHLLKGTVQSFSLILNKVHKTTEFTVCVLICNNAVVSTIALQQEYHRLKSQM